MSVDATALDIYLLAGVKTVESSFAACKQKLDAHLRSSGIEPAIHVLFPYGDASRNVVRQVLEVRSDLSNGITAGRIGGRKVWRHVKDSFRGHRMLLIGHSGGGAAAYQAARFLLENDGVNHDFRVVQVGSPRTPIVPKLRDRVCYFHSIDCEGKHNDPITRIGSWGGWSRMNSKVPRWDRNKYAPGYIEGIATVGGHADYFRHTDPYIDNDQICNLDKTMGRMLDWLKGWL